MIILKEPSVRLFFITLAEYRAYVKLPLLIVTLSNAFSPLISKYLARVKQFPSTTIDFREGGLLKINLV